MKYAFFANIMAIHYYILSIFAWLIKHKLLIHQTMSDSKLLTRSEFQAMVILWNLPVNGAFTKDILSKYDDPKPAYTTLATFMKILTNKGFVKVKKMGNMLYYTPRVTKEQYSETLLRHSLQYMYDGDATRMFSFAAERLDLSNEQIDEITAKLQSLKK